MNTSNRVGQGTPAAASQRLNTAIKEAIQAQHLDIKRMYLEELQDSPPSCLTKSIKLFICPEMHLTPKQTKGKKPVQ